MDAHKGANCRRSPLPGKKLFSLYWGPSCFLSPYRGPHIRIVLPMGVGGRVGLASTAHHLQKKYAGAHAVIIAVELQGDQYKY